MHSCILNLLVVACLLLGFTSCQPDEVEFNLPPKTEDGRNTLGFIANGKVWVNHGEICDLLTCEDNVVTGHLHTYADGTLGVVIQAYHNQKDKNISQIFSVNVKNVNGTGTYMLNNENEEQMSLITDWSKNIFYLNTQTSDARLVITKLDAENHIISGDFSGKLYNYQNPSESIEIRDGRFDTKLTYTNE